MVYKFLYASLLLLLILIIVGNLSPLEAQEVTFTHFPLHDESWAAHSISSGPDGNLWYTGWNNIIGRMTPTGETTEFQLERENAEPQNITTGPDGNLWFTQYNGNHIGKITTQGEVEEFPFPTAYNPSFGISSGPDGNLWFAQWCCWEIGKVTTSGVVSEVGVRYYMSGEGSSVGANIDITTGSDGNLWYTNYGQNRIGKYSLDGSFHIEYVLPRGGPESITSGPDGNLWFTLSSNYIGKITTEGVVTVFDLPNGSGTRPGIRSQPISITNGPDGNLWFVGVVIEETSFYLGRITPEGEITIFPYAGDTHWPHEITTGPDNNLWIAGSGGIWRVTLDNSSEPEDPDLIIGDTGFRPDKDGFGLKNFGEESAFYKELSQDSFIQYYGKDRTLLPDGRMRLAAGYEYSTNYKDTATIGRCFGFSGASIVNFSKADQTAVGDYALAQIEDLFQIKSPSDYPAMMKKGIVDSLGYYHGVQLGGDFKNNWFTLAPPKDVYYGIKQSIDKGEPVQVGVKGYASNNKGEHGYGGHSMVGYKYHQEGEAAKVSIYDNESPGHEEVMHFDLKENSFSYVNAHHPDEVLWTSTTGNTYVDMFPADQYVEQGLPSWENGLEFTLVVPSSLRSIITTDSGERLGLQDGILYDEIQDAAMIPLYLDTNNLMSVDQQQRYALKKGREFTLKIQSTGDATEPIHFFGNNSHFSVDALATSQDSQVDIILADDGKNITISDPSVADTYEIKMTKEIEGKSLEYTIEDVYLLPREEISFVLLDDLNKLSIKNTGADKNISIEISGYGGKDSVISLGNISLIENETQTWTPSNWSDLETKPILIEVDKDSDGIVDESKEINSQKVITINDGSIYAKNKNVLLKLNPTYAPKKMRISNSPFTDNQKLPRWMSYSAEVKWKLSGLDGDKTIYIQFQNQNGSVSEIFTEGIILDTRDPRIKTIKINNGQTHINSSEIMISFETAEDLSGIEAMRISNTNDLANKDWLNYASEFSWSLQPLPGTRPQLRHITIQLKDRAQNVSRFTKPLFY